MSRDLRVLALAAMLGGLAAPLARADQRVEEIRPTPRKEQPREPRREPVAAAKVAPEPESRQVRRAREREEAKRRKRARK